MWQLSSKTRPAQGVAALVLAAVVMVSAGALPAWAAFGELIVLRGQVTLYRGRITAVVIDRFDLEDGDRLVTAADSKAHIRLFGALAGSEAIVTEKTEFNVSDLAIHQERSPFELLAGTIRSRLLEFLAPIPFMRTPGRDRRQGHRLHRVCEAAQGLGVHRHRWADRGGQPQPARVCHSHR